MVFGAVTADHGERRHLVLDRRSHRLVVVVVVVVASPRALWPVLVVELLLRSARAKAIHVK